MVANPYSNDNDNNTSIDSLLDDRETLQPLASPSGYTYTEPKSFTPQQPTMDNTATTQPEREKQFREIDDIGSIGMRDKAGDLVSVSVGDVDKAMRNGYIFDNPDLEVPIFLPDGSTGYLKHSELQSSFSSGYRYKGFERELVDWADSHPDRLKKAIEDSQTFGTTAMMAADSFASGLTFGLTDMIASQFMTSQEKEDRTLFIDNAKAINTIANMAGSIITSVGVTYATAGLGAPLATTFSGMGFSAGASKVLATAVISTADSTLAATGMSIADSLMREVPPEELAKRALISGGVGAVLGAGLSVGAGAIGIKLAQRSGAGAAREAMGEVVEAATAAPASKIAVNPARVKVATEIGDSWDRTVTFNPVTSKGKLAITSEDPNLFSNVFARQGEEIRKPVEVRLARGLSDAKLPKELQNPENVILKSLRIKDVANPEGIVISPADELAVVKNLLDNYAGNGKIISDIIEEGSGAVETPTLRLLRTYGQEVTEVVDEGKSLARYYELTPESFNRVINPVDLNQRAVDGLQDTAKYVAKQNTQKMLRELGMKAEDINVVQRIATDPAYAQRVVTLSNKEVAIREYTQKIGKLEEFRQGMHRASETLRQEFAIRLDDMPQARIDLTEGLGDINKFTNDLWDEGINLFQGRTMAYESNDLTRNVIADVRNQYQRFIDPSTQELYTNVKTSDVFDWLRNARKAVDESMSKGAGKRIGVNDLEPLATKLRTLENSIGDADLYQAIQKASSEMASIKEGFHKAFGITVEGSTTTIDPIKVSMMLKTADSGVDMQSQGAEDALLKALRNNQAVFEKFDIVDKLPENIRNSKDILSAGFYDDLKAIKIARKSLKVVNKALDKNYDAHGKPVQAMAGLAVGAATLGVLRVGGGNGGTAVVSNIGGQLGNSLARGGTAGLFNPVSARVGGVNFTQNLASLQSNGVPSNTARGFLQRLSDNVGGASESVVRAVRGKVTDDAIQKVAEASLATTTGQIGGRSNITTTTTDEYIADTLKSMGLEPRRASESREEYYNRRVEALSKYSSKDEALALLDPVAEALSPEYAEAMANEVSKTFTRITQKLPPPVELAGGIDSISREDLRVLDNEINLVFNPLGALNKGFDAGDLEALEAFEEAYPEYVAEMRETAQFEVALLPLDVLNRKQKRAVNWLVGGAITPTEDRILPTFQNYYSNNKAEGSEQQGGGGKPLSMGQSVGTLSRSQQLSSR